MSETAYDIKPLSPQTWPAFDALVSGTTASSAAAGASGSTPTSPERGQGAEANRALKKAYVEQGKAHAALVMDGDEAIAWAEYGTPVELPTLHHRKQYDADQDRRPRLPDHLRLRRQAPPATGRHRAGDHAVRST